MSKEEEFYRDYYKHFSDDKNVYDFGKKQERINQKADKRLKFGFDEANIKYSAYDQDAIKVDISFRTSSNFLKKLENRITRIQKALEDLKNDLRKSDDF